MSFHGGRKVLRWGTELASSRSSCLLLLSALISCGCCSGTRELGAKPSQRIIWELGVWVSAMEGDTVEVVRDPPNIAHFSDCKAENKILFSLLKIS